MSERDPYAVLGVGREATPAQLAAAYRRLARRHHPDISREPDAERRMAAINVAWAILRDPDRRAAWNRGHGDAGVPSDPAAGDGIRRPAGSHRAGTAGGPVAWRRGPDGEGAAGPPPGNPRGSILPFGRHIGWSLGEVARVDPGYLAWLAGRREGARYREEIAALIAGTAAAPDTPLRHRRGGGASR